MATPIFRGMDRDALDQAYDNRRAVTDVAAIMGALASRSQAFRNASSARLNIPYGAHARERLDWFPSCQAGAPTVVFVHGGYWQSFDKEMFSAVAEGPLAHGFNVAVLEYGLAPEFRMTDIVSQVRAGVGFIAGQLPAWGAGTGQIYLVGHSAGGHLIARCMDIPGVAGGLAISGIYDLEPIRLCYLNQKLAMTADESAAQSQITHLPPRAGPLCVAWGLAELPELIRQSETFLAVWRDAGYEGLAMPLPAVNHFSVLWELVKSEGQLSRSLSDLVALAHIRPL